jgi:hypothetical protein
LKRKKIELSIETELIEELNNIKDEFKFKKGLVKFLSKNLTNEELNNRENYMIGINQELKEIEIDLKEEENEENKINEIKSILKNNNLKIAEKKKLRKELRIKIKNLNEKLIHNRVKREERTGKVSKKFIKNIKQIKLKL